VTWFKAGISGNGKNVDTNLANKHKRVFQNLKAKANWRPSSRLILQQAGCGESERREGQLGKKGGPGNGSPRRWGWGIPLKENDPLPEPSPFV
jgi:hypothetical protein